MDRRADRILNELLNAQAEERSLAFREEVSGIISECAAIGRAGALVNRRVREAAERELKAQAKLRLDLVLKVVDDLRLEITPELRQETQNVLRRRIRGDAQRIAQQARGRQSFMSDWVVREIEPFVREWLARLELELEGRSKPEPESGSLKEADVDATDQSRFVSEERIAELRAVKAGTFDLRKLVRLCEELNLAYSAGAFFATAMLTRAILDHVPPLLGVTTFSQVANNYAGSRSFRSAMNRLQKAARKIADEHLHGPIRRREALPVAQQVNFAAEVDMLLAEITRVV